MRPPMQSVSGEVAVPVGNSESAVSLVWEQLAPQLRERARSITDDGDQQADLLQEALVHLWEADPTRFDLRDEEEARYLHRMLVNRMKRVWGRKAPGRGSAG